MKMKNKPDFGYIAKEVLRIIRQAGDIAMHFYNGDLGIEVKTDGSPVTSADKTIEKYIRAELAKLTPAVPVIGEEGDKTLKDKTTSFWLVDPIDGTKEFINKNGEFTVNIALIENNRPIFGAVFAPAFDELYVTETPDKAVCIQSGVRFELSKVARERKNDEIIQYISRSHFDKAVTDEMLGGQAFSKQIPMGSSLKLCRIARGDADIFAFTHETHEWDTAAAHAVAGMVGCQFITYPQGQELTYGKIGSNLKNPCIIIKGQNCR